ncbi:fumarylacetoacetate hydrolase family protein [Streptomyces sp. NPDC002144]
MATLAQPAGPFALGTFSAGEDGKPFPGLLARERVLDLSAALEWTPADVRAVLERWEQALPLLHTLAEDPSGDWRPLDGLRVYAPVEPRQIFQSGANYRQHVIDLELAHRSPDDPRTVEEARAEIAAVMDRRAAEDLPYVFIGLPSAITGPYDDVVLPAWAEQGPYLVTADELEKHRDEDGFLRLGLTASVNGETVGTDLLSNMSWTFEEMVAYASRGTWVRPGDVLGSGTCGNGGCLAELWGVRGSQDPPPLRPGDTVTLTVEGIGSVSNTVVAGPDPVPVPAGRRRSRERP